MNKFQMIISQSNERGLLGGDDMRAKTLKRAARERIEGRGFQAEGPARTKAQRSEGSGEGGLGRARAYRTQLGSSLRRLEQWGSPHPV